MVLNTQHNIETILNNDEYFDNGILELGSVIYGYDISSWHVLDDTIFLGNRCSLTDTKPNLVALDLNTLKEKWKFNYKDGEAGTGNILSKNNFLYFVDEKVMHVLDIKTGKEEWKFKYVYPYNPDIVIGIGKLDIKDESLYLADYRQVYSIGLENRRVKWKFPHEDAKDFNILPYYELQGLPILDDKKIYLAFENGKICALNRDTGIEEWVHLMEDNEIKRNVLVGNFEASMECFTTPKSPTFHRNSVIFGDNKNLYSLDANNGKLKWAFPIKKNGKIELCCENDNIYLSNRHDLYILDAKTGRDKLKIPYYIWVNTMATDDKYLFLGSNCNKLDIRNKNNVKEKKTEIEFDSAVIDVLIMNNKAYVHTYNNLYIFNKK